VTESLGQADQRPRKGTAAAEPCEILVTGRLFYDMVFAGLSRLPGLGEEIYAPDLVTCPGGVASRAVGCARLGLRSRLSTAFGDDPEGSFCWDFLLAEGIDLSASRRYENWQTPVTVSAALHDDRAMLTHASAPPDSFSAGLDYEYKDAPVLAELDPLGEISLQAEPWFKTARDARARIFATTAVAASSQSPADFPSRLDGIYALLLNEAEALQYTDSQSLARALGVLSEVVPLAIITRGADGAVGHDATRAETIEVPALATSVMDSTGSGDAFAAAIVYGTMRSWPLEQSLAFANLCSHLAIQRIGSSVACPTWHDIDGWWSHTQRQAGNSSPELTVIRSRYAFLAELLSTAVDL
jgi:sugar/nucleoside kinase (ribokinase family)